MRPGIGQFLTLHNIYAYFLGWYGLLNFHAFTGTESEVLEAQKVLEESDEDNECMWLVYMFVTTIIMFINT